MRRRVSLYIAGKAVDLDSEAFILFNHTMEEAGNPTIVRNSFSQQVTLKGTANNNRLFGAIWRSDRRTVSGQAGTGPDFNATRKTPFTVYDETGEILESGYCKLDKVTRKGAAVEYTVSFFGDLGAFFYGLAYDSGGNRRTLADLKFTGESASDTELDFTITKDVVASAWAALAGGSVIAPSRRLVARINPDGTIHSDTAVKYHVCAFPVTGLARVLVTGRSPSSNYALASVQDADGTPLQVWEVNRNRVYTDYELELPSGSATLYVYDLNQDPSASFSQTDTFRILNFAPAYNGLPTGLFDADKALFSPALAGVALPEGHSLPGGDVALASLPKKYTEWETQDLRSYLQRPVIKMSAIINAICQPYNNGGFTVDLDPAFFSQSNPWWDKTWLTLPVINTLDIQISEGSGNLTVSVPTATIPGGGNPSTTYRVTVALRPRITVPGGGSTVGYVLHCEDTYTPEGETTALTGWYMTYLTFSAYAYDANGNALQRRVVTAATRVSPGQYGIPEIDFVGSFDNNGDWVGEDVTMEFEGIGIHHISIGVGGTAAGWGSLRHTLDASVAWEDSEAMPPYEPNHAVSAFNFSMPQAGNTYRYTTSSSARSGVTITKRMLLSSDKTPADYLISYAKMFGLVFLFDKSERRMSLMKRQTFFRNNVTDISGRVDLSRPVPVLPFAFDCKWYDFGVPYEHGEFAKYYANVYDREFGVQKVNTGYGFNSESKDLLAGIAFRGACQCLEASKYYATLVNGTLRVPSVFQDSGGSFSANDRAGKAVDVDIPLPSASVYRGWWNTVNKTFDIIAKPQFHEAGNAAYEERDTLLFFAGMEDISTVTDRLALSDDTALMMALNDNTPCWILDPSAVGGYSPLTSLPVFSRYLVSGGTVTESLDFGTPGEVSIPDVTFAADSSIYSRFWATYIADRYDDDSRVLTARVNLAGMRVGPELMRDFYYFDGSVWALNKIINHSLTTWDDTECEFIKVQDINNYLD